MTLHDLLLLLHMRAGGEETVEAFVAYEVQASLRAPQQARAPPHFGWCPVTANWLCSNRSRYCVSVCSHGTLIATGPKMASLLKVMDELC